MVSPSCIAPRECEYVLKFKKNLSIDKRNEVIHSIKTNVLFNKEYENNGNTWYELRSKNNQKEEAPDISLLVQSDYVYVMRKDKYVPLWQDLESFRECIEDDLEFVTQGAFYSYNP